MNTPPTDGVRVAADALRQLVFRIYAAVPVAEAHARLVSDLLVDTELRGVVSHGMHNAERYVRSWQQGRMNPDPQIRVLREGPATAALSGDGGLGMLVGTQAMEMAIERARDIGIGATTTTYHDHIGSAGKYVRMANRQGLIGICTSGRNAAPQYKYEATIHGSIQGSPPLAFGFPGGEDRPDFLLDYASHTPWDEAVFRQMPAVFIKAIGMSHVANILSGTLGGQMLPEFDRRHIQWKGADQSGFYLALDPGCFTSPEAFAADIDRLMDEASKMRPLPGFEVSTLPGGLEWQRERDYLKNGIPISRQAMDSLERLAGEFGLRVPWAMPGDAP